MGIQLNKSRIFKDSINPAIYSLLQMFRTTFLDMFRSKKPVLVTVPKRKGSEKLLLEKLMELVECASSEAIAKRHKTADGVVCIKQINVVEECIDICKKYSTM
jgi:hypothetical protein